MRKRMVTIGLLFVGAFAAPAACGGDDTPARTLPDASIADTSLPDVAPDNAQPDTSIADVLVPDAADTAVSDAADGAD